MLPREAKNPVGARDIKKADKSTPKSKRHCDTYPPDPGIIKNM